MIKVIPTSDKSNTLYSEQFDEHYHSTHGAINESMHIFIKEALLYSSLKKATIFEVGFGTGLNAFLTFIESLKNDLSITYISLEKYPVDIDTSKQLNYADIIAPEYLSEFMKMHSSAWNEQVIINNGFKLIKILDDFNQYELKEKVDIIFFDAFSPDTQPELWSFPNFKKLYNALNDNGILITYSSKGIVKDNLRKAGFVVKRLKGPVGKRHIIRAEKKNI
ncbi:MAG: tRNA (5-methylaminomethyl-2-thiouridine)(34)-methyltransferase MnmD [Bacteroidales bacterium]|nr:tRNA (5-methylaminomethyl-2-thiouridine)(34)-methyltransferase MnmD [Bacteroidales bacterium]